MNLKTAFTIGTILFNSTSFALSMKEGLGLCESIRILKSDTTQETYNLRFAVNAYKSNKCLSIYSAQTLSKMKTISDIELGLKTPKK